MTNDPWPNSGPRREPYGPRRIHVNKGPVGRLFSPHGRMSRLPYLGYSLLLVVASVVIGFAVSFIYAGVEQSTPGYHDPRTAEVAARWIPLLVIAWPAICIGAQRLHDTGRSGLWQFLGLIPLVNLMLGLYMLFWPGNTGENAYGPPSLRPKGA